MATLTGASDGRTGAEVVVCPEAPRMRNYCFARYSFYGKTMGKCRT